MCASFICAKLNQRARERIFCTLFALSIILFNSFGKTFEWPILSILIQANGDIFHFCQLPQTFQPTLRPLDEKNNFLLLTEILLCNNLLTSFSIFDDTKNAARTHIHTKYMIYTSRQCKKKYPTIQTLCLRIFIHFVLSVIEEPHNWVATNIRTVGKETEWNQNRSNVSTYFFSRFFLL